MGHKITTILRHPTTHYCLHSSPILVQFPARTIQSAPCQTSYFRYILILSYHLHIGLPSVLFSSGFPTKFVHAILLSLIYATCTYGGWQQCIHSFSSLSYDRSKASSKASYPHSAIQSFLFQMRVVHIDSIMFVTKHAIAHDPVRTPPRAWMFVCCECCQVEVSATS